MYFSKININYKPILLGGLHKFSNWYRHILTDSGRFQVWTHGELKKII